ncbi:MAG TPA: type II toxin-antitoxin system RelE/ParE family toxin [Bacteroidetes bacterium]|nr:type II toxin-antitoxin system RelE/ParE family toxin [Bacteroidota bacterium]
MEVYWTQGATGDLFVLMDSLISQQGIPPHIVRKIIAPIFIRMKSLTHIPHYGMPEPLLLDRNKRYRYLHEGSYKVIYRVTKTVIFIIAVVDAEKMPEKIQDKPEQFELGF